MKVEDDEGDDDILTAIEGNDIDSTTLQTHTQTHTHPGPSVELDPGSHRDDSLLKTAVLSSKSASTASRTLDLDSKKPVFLTEEDEMREKEMEKQESQKSSENQVH